MRPGARIGVDVGSARVGVAVCDRDGILATPHATLARPPAPSRPDVVTDDDPTLATLADLAARNDPIEFVLGLPLSLSGREGPAAQTVRAYARALAARVRSVPVRLLDERLTTLEAHRVLRDGGRDTRTHRAVVDQVAAVMILQTALDIERVTGNAPGIILGRKARHTKGRDR